MGENKKSQFLLDDFPPVSTQQWEDQIIKDLKGADYEKKLIWNSEEGFKVKPYYRSEDLNNLSYLEQLPGQFPFVRSTKTQQNNWEIRQDILVSDIKKANEYALEVLNKGATSIGFDVKKDIIKTTADLDTLLDGIYIDCINLNFLTGQNSPGFAKLVNDYLKGKKVAGSVDVDPIGNLTITGSFYGDIDSDMEAILPLLEGDNNFKILAVNGYNFSNAGATIVQELGLSISIVAEYISLLQDKGASVENIIRKLQLNFGIGSNYFMEIAKFRAARVLVAKMIEGFDASVKEQASVFMHAVTSDWNKTIYDPYVNMLRTTTEAMSAILGGADSLTVKGFDAVFGKPNDRFSDRIARNTQIILKEEAYFDKIVDPGAGSYYIENLTDSIAENAWNLFLSIESKGGYIEAFKQGFVQKIIGESAENRLKQIQQRRDIVVGTNQYANPSETLNDKVDLDLAFAENRKSSNAIAEPIRLVRGSGEYEKLRLATEKHTKKPIVFLLTIGNLTMRKARASFAYNFFSCAGYEVIDNNGFENVDSGLAAAKNACADIVVVCSSDDEYAEYATEAYTKGKESAIIVVAGAPACMDDLKTKGIEHFIHLKTNALLALRQFHNELGIKM